MIAVVAVDLLQHRQLTGVDSAVILETARSVGASGARRVEGGR